MCECCTVIGWVAVAANQQGAVGSTERNQHVKGATCGAGVTASDRTPRSRSQTALLTCRTMSGARMRRRVETIDEPGVCPHRCGDSERIVLGELERFEVVEDKRLVHRPAELGEGPRHQQDRVAPEPRRQPSHSRRRAPQRARDLPVRRAGDQPGRDRPQQLGPLAIVGHGESLPGERAPAGQTEEAGNPGALAADIHAVTTEAVIG